MLLRRTAEEIVFAVLSALSKLGVTWRLEKQQDPLSIGTFNQIGIDAEWETPEVPCTEAQVCRMMERDGAHFAGAIARKILERSLNRVDILDLIVPEDSENRVVCKFLQVETRPIKNGMAIRFDLWARQQPQQPGGVQ